MYIYGGIGCGGQWCGDGRPGSGAGVEGKARLCGVQAGHADGSPVKLQRGAAGLLCVSFLTLWLGRR